MFIGFIKFKGTYNTYKAWDAENYWWIKKRFRFNKIIEDYIKWFTKKIYRWVKKNTLWCARLSKDIIGLKTSKSLFTWKHRYSQSKRFENK